MKKDAKVYWISLLCAKYFVKDCRSIIMWSQFVKVAISPLVAWQLSNWGTLTFKNGYRF